MKKLLISLLFIGCGIRHQPTDFTKPVVITDIEVLSSEKNKETAIYHCSQAVLIQSGIINKMEGWFVDSLYKFRVGDTILIIKR